MRFLSGALGCFLVVLIGLVGVGLVGMALMPTFFAVAGMADAGPQWNHGVPLFSMGFGVNWASMLVLLMVLCAAILALLGLMLLSRSPRRSTDRQPVDEERLVQELHQRGMALERRLESLETLLIGRDRRGDA